MNFEGPKVCLKWFREGEPIPYGSKYIKAERRKVGTSSVEVEDLPYGGQSSWHTEQRDKFEEQYLYEVPYRETK